MKLVHKAATVFDERVSASILWVAVLMGAAVSFVALLLNMTTPAAVTVLILLGASAVGLVIIPDSN